MGVSILLANVSPAQARHLAKDNYKSTHANVLLATPGSPGATGEYLRIWHSRGAPVNTIVPDGIYFVSANGIRKNAKPPPLEIIAAVAAHDKTATFLTDGFIRRPEGGNPYNKGEQEVAEYLRSLGYSETQEYNGLVARWTK